MKRRKCEYERRIRGYENVNMKGYKYVDMKGEKLSIWKEENMALGDKKLLSS